MLSVARNFSAVIVLFLTVFVLGCVISGAISVRQAIENTDLILRGDLPVAAIVETDGEAMRRYEIETGQWPEIPIGLSPEMLSEIGSLPYVKRWDYSLEAWGLMSGELERYILDGETIAGSEADTDWSFFNLKGVRSAELFEVEEGVIELVAGRMFSEEEASTLSYTALVSENFAQINNLHIGSSFTLHNMILDIRDTDVHDIRLYDNEENLLAQRSYDFEVIGIFVPNVEFDTGDEWMDLQFQEEMENRIYTPNAVALAAAVYQIEQNIIMDPGDANLDEDPADTLWFHNIYVLHDPSEMDSFKRAVLEIVPEFHTVTNTSDAYDRIAASMETLEMLSTGVLWASVAASIVILTLLITLSLRGRRREIGILLALGERRGRIVFLTAFEILVIALVAVSFSLIVGNFISGGISETMLRNGLIAGQMQDFGMSFSNLDFMGFSNSATIDEVMASYDTSLTASMIATFFVATIGTVLAATIAPMLYILRLNPRKIMM